MEHQVHNMSTDEIYAELNKKNATDTSKMGKINERKFLTRYINLSIERRRRAKLDKEIKNG